MLGGAHAELVDLRLPKEAFAPGAPEASEKWYGLSQEIRAAAWVADAKQSDRLSLRDPLEPTRQGLRCNFSMTSILGCRGHVSSHLQTRTKSNHECALPLDQLRDASQRHLHQDQVKSTSNSSSDRHRGDAAPPLVSTSYPPLPPSTLDRQRLALACFADSDRALSPELRRLCAADLL